MRILELVQYIPIKDHICCRQAPTVVNKFTEELIDEKTETVVTGAAENKDVNALPRRRGPARETDRANGRGDRE